MKLDVEEQYPFRLHHPGSNINFKPHKVCKRVNPPNLPPTPFMRFSKHNLRKLKECNQNSKDWNLGRIMGKLWRELPEKDKVPYFESYNLDKAEFDRKLKAFYNNPSQGNHISVSDLFPTDQHDIGTRADSPSEYNILMESEETIIDPAVDEEDLTEHWFIEKQVAWARYIRNHKLMAVILSPLILSNVEDESSADSNARLVKLKSSSSTLEAYLKKKNVELEDLEKMHRQIMNYHYETNKEFYRNLKETQVISTMIKACSPPIKSFPEESNASP